MIVFRLTRKRYPVELSGKGAAVYGARWNSPGVEMIYTAESRALAMAEVVVHLSVAMLPADFAILKIEIPETVSLSVVDESSLPADWAGFPYALQTQKIGDRFASEFKTCVMKVPSAVVKGDYNYLVNPYHGDFGQIKIIEINDFAIDRRMFK